VGLFLAQALRKKERKKSSIKIMHGFANCIHTSVTPVGPIFGPLSRGSFLQKEGFEIWSFVGGGFITEIKLGSTSSAEQKIPDEITWIT